MTSIFKRKGRKGYALKYRDPGTLKWRTRQFATKTEAQNEGDRIRAKARATEGLEPDAPFEEYARRWLDMTAVAVRHGTFRSYEWAVLHYLIPAFRAVSLRGITPRMVRDLVGRLRVTGLAKGTVSNVRATLHSCLEAAVEDHILAANPARFRSRSKLMSLTTTPGEHRAKVKAMTAEQARRLLAAAPSVAPRYALMFRTMLLSGLRPGEALALKPTDVEDGRLRLERALTPQGRLEPCKTDAEGQFHHVDIPDSLAADLRAVAGPWLFTGRDGGPCEHRGAQQAFTRVLGAAGLPLHFTPHCLRHTYASLQLVAGESVYYVSRQLRHSDIRITVSRYGSWLPAGNRAAANRLAEALCHQDVTSSPALDSVTSAKGP